MAIDTVIISIYVDKDRDRPVPRAYRKRPRGRNTRAGLSWTNNPSTKKRTTEADNNIDATLNDSFDASEEQTSYYGREALQVLAAKQSEVVIIEFDAVLGIDRHNLPNEWEDYEVREDG